jgi:hypothetical protein
MSDAAPAPAKKASSKPKAKPEHPGFTVMATEAIAALKEVRMCLGPCFRE